jgi:signal transduction histidine kinase
MRGRTATIRTLSSKAIPAVPSKKRPSAAADATEELVDAGLQHAILMRAMPVLRHDVAGPLSVMRMGTMLLKRRLAKGDMTPEQAVERVEQLEGQLDDITHHIRRLRLWDLQISDKHNLRAIAHEAAELARPALMVRGIEMEPEPVDLQTWDEGALLPHTMLYVVLAAIYHLAEHTSPPPAHITIGPVGDKGMRVQARGVSTASHLQPDMQASSSAQPPAIDMAALLRLAKPLGVQVQATDGEITVVHPGA